MCAPTNLYSPQTRSISVRKQIMLNAQSKRVYERIVTGAAARSAARAAKGSPYNYDIIGNTAQSPPDGFARCCLNKCQRAKADHAQRTE